MAFGYVVKVEEKTVERIDEPFGVDAVGYHGEALNVGKEHRDHAVPLRGHFPPLLQLVNRLLGENALQ